MDSIGFWTLEHFSENDEDEKKWEPESVRYLDEIPKRAIDLYSLMPLDSVASDDDVLKKHGFPV